MQDIDQFSEEKMSASNLQDFENSLPPQLRSKYIASFEGTKRYWKNVVQGYKGPSRLRKPGSEYSETEVEYLGVQKISFWYAASKQINWFPFVGTVAYTAVRLTQLADSSTDWRFLYFNANTGEILDKTVAQDLMEKTRKSEENYQDGEKLFLSENYEEALKKYKSAFKNCITGYKNQSKFKDAMDKTEMKIVAQWYKEADDLNQEKRYQEALELYKKADRVSKNQEEKQQSRDKQALILKNIGDQLRSTGTLDEAMQKLIEAHELTTNVENKSKIDDSIALIYAKEGENFFNEGKYKEAKIKFEQALGKTKQSHDTDNFNFWIERIKNELEVVPIKDQADLLYNNQKYEQAIDKYRQASQKTLQDNEKLKYETLIHEIERKLRDLQASSQEVTEEQKKLQAYDLVNKGLVLILDGNALFMTNNIGLACEKYDEAMEVFETAAKTFSMNIIFNSILKLIDAYYNAQSYDDALKVIEKGKSLFPDKFRVFEQIKEKICSRDCSLDYLKRFMMEEERKSENQGSTTQNLNFNPL